MRILKMVGHLGVDSMLQAALGNYLTTFRHKDKEGKYTDVTGYMPKLQIDYTENIDIIHRRVWDIVIIDNIDTWQVVQKIKPRFNNKIWYIHGTYHTWRSFQVFANDNLEYSHILYPDVSRKSYIKRWYKHQPHSELIIPIHLQSKHFPISASDRNGRCYVMGNEIMHAAALYGNTERVQWILDNLRQFDFDLFGFNAKPPVPEKNFKGSASPIREHVKDYSVSVHPSQVETMSFVLLESMAAGVPVITTPKVDLPMSMSGKAYIIARTPEEFIKWTRELTNNDSLANKMGAAGQTFLKQTFPFRDYQRKLIRWCKKIIDNGPKR